MNKNMIIAVVLIVLAAAGGFYGGMFYQKSQRSQFVGGFGGGQFRQRFGQNANAGFVRGQIVSMDNSTVTVQLMDGSSKLLILGSHAMFVKTDTASKNDLKIGDTIMAIGTTNSDGSVTAQSVQLHPQMGLGRGARPGGQDSQSPMPQQQGASNSGY